MSNITIFNISKKTKIENVRTADTLLSKARGLMFKKSGRLLLKFNIPNKHAIWMPNMLFSLDLIFIDADKKVVDIIKNASPLTLNPKTWKIYKPKRKCSYVLEVEAGLANKKRFKVWDKLKFR